MGKGVSVVEGAEGGDTGDAMGKGVVKSDRVEQRGEPESSSGMAGWRSGWNRETHLN